VAGIGPGSTAMGWIRARRAPAAPHGPHSPEPASGSQPEPRRGPADVTEPAWLAAANRIRANLTGYEPGTDQQRAATCPHDRDVLARLAELSEQMSPYQAALTLFEGDR
jgi:hypothetical protein